MKLLTLLATDISISLKSWKTDALSTVSGGSALGIEAARGAAAGVLAVTLHALLRIRTVIVGHALRLHCDCNVKTGNIVNCSFSPP